MKKFLGSGKSPLELAKQTTTLTISNDEMEDIIKVVKSLEDSGLLLKGGEAQEQKGGFFSMLLSTLGASLLGYILAGKGVIAKRESLRDRVKE